MLRTPTNRVQLQQEPASYRLELRALLGARLCLCFDLLFCTRLQPCSLVSLALRAYMLLRQRQSTRSFSAGGGLLGQQQVRPLPRRESNLSLRPKHDHIHSHHSHLFRSSALVAC